MLLHSTCDPIWVTNPRTGEKLNVAPIFEACEQFDGQANTPANLSNAIGRIIFVVALTEPNPAFFQSSDIVDINHDLYLLREMFDAMVAPPPLPAAA